MFELSQCGDNRLSNQGTFSNIGNCNINYIRSLTHTFMINHVLHLVTRCPILMVTGSKASANQPVRLLFEKMNDQISKRNTEMMEVDGVANVLEERVRRIHCIRISFL